MPTRLNPKLLSWAPDIEVDTIDQAWRASNLPFVHGHVALMPDAHHGYGVPVGTVLPTEGAIVPYAVGYDIGCGMIAARLDLTASDLPDDLTALHAAIAERVPAGKGQGHNFMHPDRPLIHATDDLDGMTPELRVKAGHQFGTLGGGNHFIEVSLDEFDDVWLVLHSGSRGVGHDLAEHHIDVAKGLMKQYFITLDDPDLAYLAQGTDEFDAYIAVMLWAQDYAAGNRKAMLGAVVQAVMTTLGRSVAIVDEINCHHNYTEREHHRGRNLWITRKGAIRARLGDRGVIPGSMGASTFIVRGLGNPASYHSCSHGAGRTMGRKEARRRLDPSTFAERMKGITWNEDDELLDEHPDAYKNVDEVMAAQADLVTIEHRLHQVLNYKGVS